MAKHAVLNTQNRVVNLIEIDEGANWSPPPGRSVLFSPLCVNAEIGGTWDGTAFSPAPPPPPDPIAPDIARLRNYMLSAELDAYLANASPPPADTVAALKETIRAFRSLLRVVRGMTQ